MSDSPSKTDSAPHTARGIRIVAIFTWLVIGLVSGATLAASLVDYFARAAIPARSLGGIAVMVVSVITTLTAITFLLTLKRFATLSSGRQLALGLAAPVGCLLLIGLFMVIGLSSSTPVLPLPVTPSITVRFDGDAGLQIDVDPYLARNGGTRSTSTTYECFVGYGPGSIWPLRQFVYSMPAAPKQSLIKISGMQVANQDAVHTTMQFTTSETVCLRVDGVSAPEVTLDDTPVRLPGKIQPGSYKLTIVGHQ